MQRDQVIYSTHSPYLIPPDKLHRLRIVLKKPEAGTTIVEKLSHVDLQGEDFSDVLSPVLTAIGIDIREQLNFVGKNNVVVEGISDFYYLQAWRSLISDPPNLDTNMFPGTGASSTVLLSSLFIGWGLNFIVVLDHDEEGNAIKQKLVREMGIDEKQVVQPEQASGIEDLFSHNDFNELLESYNSSFKLNPGERPTRAIKRLGIDKVLLARNFAARASAGKVDLTKATQDSVRTFLNTVSKALVDAVQLGKGPA